MRFLLLIFALGPLLAGLSACSSDGGDGGTAPTTEPLGCPENRWPPCPEEEDDRPRGFLPGTVAPSVEGVDQFGDRVVLEQFRGGTVVLSVGATWCRSCNDDAAGHASNRDFLLEAVEGPLWMIDVLDDARDPDDPAQTAWAEAYGIEDPVLGGDGAAAAGRALAVSTFPTKIVIDHEGRIVGRVSGSGQWEQVRVWVQEADLRRADHGSDT